MFALKKFSSLALLVLSLSYQVSGHAIVTPALGVTGTPARSDVTKPSTNTPCGKGVNVASAISGSTAVQASGNAFTVSVTNFNGWVVLFLISKLSIYLSSSSSLILVERMALPNS